MIGSQNTSFYVTAIAWKGKEKKFLSLFLTFFFLSIYRFFFLAVNFVSWSHKDLTASKHKNLTLPAKFVHCQFLRQTSRITTVLWFFCNSFVNIVRTTPIQSACYCLAKNSWRRQWKNVFPVLYLHFPLAIDRNTSEKWQGLLL